MFDLQIYAADTRMELNIFVVNIGDTLKWKLFLVNIVRFV